MHIINITRVYTAQMFIVLLTSFLLSVTPISAYAQTDTTELPKLEGENKRELDKVKKLLTEGKLDQAGFILIKLLQESDDQQDNSQKIELYFAAGKLNYKQKKFQEAITQYQKAAVLITDKDEDGQRQLARIYHEIAQCYKHLKALPQSISYYNKALQIHSKRQDNKQIAQALKNIAWAENKQQNYIMALDHALRSLTHLESDNNSTRYAQIALITGIIYRNIGHYENSLNYITQAQKIYDQEDDIRHLAEVDNQIGLIYTKLQQLDSAKDFYKQTINLPINKVKPETRAAAFRELGVINYHQGHLNTSVSMLKKALNIYLSINSQDKITRVNLLLGRSYKKKKQPARATEYFKQSLTLARQFEQIDLQIRALNALAEMMLKQDRTKAISLLEQALTLQPKIEDKDDRITTYHLLKEAEKAQGNVKKALYYAEKKHQLFKLLQQKLGALDVTKNQVILASYKLEMELNKLRENAELNALKLAHQQSEIYLMQQSQQIAELELNRKHFTNTLLASLLIIFVMFIVYILYRYNKTQTINQELDYLASKDPLTNCYNRRVLFKRYNETFEAEQTPTNYSVILADIDSFKLINDSYGHSTGDVVLQGVAKILQANSKEFDTVARFGGEEFCILLPNATTLEAKNIAELMRKDIESTAFDTLAVTCSFGVASFQSGVDCDLTLIERADIALYQSKYDGKNRVTVWDFHSMDRSSKKYREK